MTSKDDWGEIIKRARKAKGWTQQELGKRSGVNYTRISRIERGDEASDEAWQALARVLGLKFTPAKLEER